MPLLKIVPGFNVYVKNVIKMKNIFQNTENIFNHFVKNKTCIIDKLTRKIIMKIKHDKKFLSINKKLFEIISYILVQ